MSLPLTREVGSLASSEGEIMKRDNNALAFDSSRVFSTILYGIESIIILLYFVVLSLPRRLSNTLTYQFILLPPRQRGLNRVFYSLKPLGVRG